MGGRTHETTQERWARLRHAVVAPLLASPPEPGLLGATLEVLARQRYRHPMEPDRWVSFGRSSIERWYYQARDAADPVAALRRRVRSDAGRNRAMPPRLLATLERQYRQHSRWSYKLHSDNLTALVVQRPELGPAPSYSTVCRRMKAHGWLPKKRLPKHATPGQRKAHARLEQREVRSFERERVHALWHSDFHQGYCRVQVDGEARWHTPVMLAFMDDRSRLCCHAQWYLAENADNFIHGLAQALAKRGLPREMMTDNGGALTALEARNGFARLGIEHETTLPHSPYQNGKQESFWNQVDGRLLAMLEDVEPLTLDFLNQATQAWVEGEYNRTDHEELGCPPLTRLLEGPDVSRPAPDAAALRLAFTLQETRTQRRSDGTLSIGGVRFEVPSRFRHLRTVVVRYQSFDLSTAWLVDERTGEPVARLLPQDKARNADSIRRGLEPVSETGAQDDTIGRDPLPPLMRQLLDDHAAAGLPPAYLRKDNARKEDEDE